MKWKTLIFAAVLIVLTIFTVLYFVKPRTVQVASFIDVIPDSLMVASEPEAPDTLYTLTELKEAEVRVRKAMRALIEKAKKEKNAAFLQMISYKERVATAEEALKLKLAEGSTIEEVSLVMAEKTFYQALMGEKTNEPLLDVESLVKVTASCPVILIMNDIKIKPNKDLLAEEWKKSLPPPKSNFKQGYFWGIGTTAAIVVTLFVTKVVKF